MEIPGIIPLIYYLGNVAFTEGSLGLKFTQKLFAKLQCCHVRPPLWHAMNTEDGKCENKSLLLLFSAILKILPAT